MSSKFRTHKTVRTRIGSWLVTDQVNSGDTFQVIDSGVVPCREKMLSSGTDPESYITEHTCVYGDRTARNPSKCSLFARKRIGHGTGCDHPGAAPRNPQPQIRPTTKPDHRSNKLSLFGSSCHAVGDSRLTRRGTTHPRDVSGLSGRSLAGPRS